MARILQEGFNDFKYDEVVMNSIQYDIIKIVQSKAISKEYLRQSALEIEQTVDMVMDELVFRFNAYFKKVDGKPLKIPKDWWQHLKLTHAPKWFLKKWPVIFTIYNPQALFMNEKLDLGSYTKGGILYSFTNFGNSSDLADRELTSGEKLYEAFEMLLRAANALREISRDTDGGVSQFAKDYENRIRHLLLDLEAPSYMLNDTPQKMTDGKP